MVLFVFILAIAVFLVILDFVSGVGSIGNKVIHDKSIELVQECFSECELFNDGSKAVHLYGNSNLKANYISRWGIIYSYYINTEYGDYNVLRFSKIHFFINKKIKKLRKANTKVMPKF